MISNTNFVRLVESFPVSESINHSKLLISPSVIDHFVDEIADRIIRNYKDKYFEDVEYQSSPHKSLSLTGLIYFKVENAGNKKGDKDWHKKICREIKKVGKDNNIVSVISAIVEKLPQTLTEKIREENFPFIPLLKESNGRHPYEQFYDDLKARVILLGLSMIKKAVRDQQRTLNQQQGI